MIKPSLEGIRALAQSDLQEREFCRDFLREIADLTGADAGIVWDASTNAFKVTAQYSSNDRPARLSLSRQEHDRLLIQAANQDAPIVVRPGESSGNANPSDTNPLLMMGRFHRLGRHVVELMIAPAPTEPDEIQRTMETFARAIQSVHQEQVDPPLSAAPETGGATSPAGIKLDDRANSFVAAIHRDIDLKLTAANVANETRRLLDCDRATVVVKHRGKFQIFAISGQPSVNRRSNTTRLLEKVARRVLRTGRGFWYPEEPEIPSQINQPLSDYLAIAATRSLVVIPVTQKAIALGEDPDSLESKRNPVIAGIVLEHCHQRWERATMEPSIQFATEHGGNAIRNARQHQQLFLYPVWRMLGKSRLLTAPRILPKAILAFAALMIAIAVLLFWQVDFYVTADGLLVPENLRPIYSRIDGDVDQVHIEHGSQVTAGQPLLQLISREHELRIRELEGQLTSAQQRLQILESQRFVERESEDTTRDNIVALKSQIDNIQERLAILEQMNETMNITSPIDGQVITWDVQRRLQGRAIQRGQELLEVADTDGSWQLEIELPVRRLQHVADAMQKSPTGHLPISFLLAADTTRRLKGEIIEIEQTAGLNADNEPIVKLKARIDDSGIGIDQTRTGVSAKIYCGKTSLGYLWLHDIGEFFQQHVWFKFQ